MNTETLKSTPKTIVHVMKAFGLLACIAMTIAFIFYMSYLLKKEALMDFPGAFFAIGVNLLLFIAAAVITVIYYENNYKEKNRVED